MKEIKLTEEESVILDDYIFRKLCKLEDAHLEDSLCYKTLTSIRAKLNNKNNN